MKKLIIQKFVCLFIFLTIFLGIQSEECYKSGKKADLTFYSYPGLGNEIVRLETTVDIFPQSAVDHVHFLTGNEISRNTLNISSIQCLRLKYNRATCPYKWQSPYIILNHITEEGCIMKLDDGARRIKAIIYSRTSTKFRSGFNLTCILGRIYDPFQSFDENFSSKTSFISVIFLSSCAGLTCVLCFGWFGLSTYRRFKQRRIKIQQQKALESSVKKILDKSPMVIFNSKIKNQDFTDDDPMCAICLESFNDHEKLRKLICSHYFHIPCIDPWLLAHQSCPLCNQNILNGPVPTISARLTFTNEESTDSPVVVS